MAQKVIKIMFLGDIVGKPGRFAVKKYIEKMEDSRPDFIIANAENASHGFGLTQKNYEELLSYGIDCFTSGNHIWDKREIFTYIDGAARLIRPINYPKGTSGKGFRVIEKNGYKIGVINLLGRTFMNIGESCWEETEEAITEMKKETPIVIMDIHAEASAEKICLGKYYGELEVSAVIGTHTHVQTSDERIYNNFCGYITDVGYCGDINGVIGMDYSVSLNRLKTSIPERLDISDSGEYEVNGVILRIDSETGRTESIERIKERIIKEEERL